MLTEACRNRGYELEETKQAALISERAQTVLALREVCGEFGDNDWSDNLHLADVVEKHLGRPLRETND